jgi:hypothetical protein
VKNDYFPVILMKKGDRRRRAACLSSRLDLFHSKVDLVEISVFGRHFSFGDHLDVRF